jgi:acyl-CoA thioesterase
MMRPRPLRPLLSLVAVATALLLLMVGATAQAPTYGGVLVTSSLSATRSPTLHEESMVATTQQASPRFHNLA